MPLLLLALSLWLAWRMVNLPPFADFLIATEAELNKVSWTTQQRLVQDTIVVLITTFLLARVPVPDGRDVADGAELEADRRPANQRRTSRTRTRATENLKW